MIRDHFPITLAVRDRTFYDVVQHVSYSDLWIFTKLGDIFHTGRDKIRYVFAFLFAAVLVRSIAYV